MQSKGLVADSSVVLKKQKGLSRVLCSQAASGISNHSEEPSESTTGLAALEQFIELNVGSWSGTFTVRALADAPSISSWITQNLWCA